MKLALSELTPSPSPSASPTSVASPLPTLPPPAMLTKHLTDGNLDTLAGYAVELLKTAAKKDQVAQDALGRIEKNFYGIVWVGERDGKEQVLRLTIDAADPPRVAARLPGIRLARDVFFSSTASARLRSVYTSTRVADPVSALIPDALQKWNVAGFLARSLGPTKDEKDTVYLQINHTELPFDRADIAIHDTALSSKDLDGFKEEVDELAEAVRYREARQSICATAVAGELASAIKATAEKCATPLPCAQAKSGQPSAEITKSVECQTLQSACIKQMLEAEDKKYNQVVSKCLSEHPIGGPDPVPIVESRFRDLIKSGGAKSLFGDAKIPNTPPTHMTIGLIGALRIGSTSLKVERVAVQNGKIASVPFDRAMTMVTVNYHPRGFDAADPVMTSGERFRVFFSGVMTPDFGLGAGVGYGLLKGLSINAGVALLLTDTLKAGEKLGDAPIARDPFRTRPAFTAFVGLGFAFK